MRPNNNAAPDSQSPENFPIFRDAVKHLMNKATMAPLTYSEAVIVLQYIPPYVVPAGETFIMEDDGEHKDYMVFILQGFVVVEASTSEGEPLAIDVVPPGRWVGELAMLDGAPRQATCRAGDDEDLLCGIMTRKNYLKLLHDHPKLAAKFALLLAFNVARHLREVQGKLVRFIELNNAHQQQRAMDVLQEARSILHAQHARQPAHDTTTDIHVHTTANMQQ